MARMSRIKFQTLRNWQRMDLDSTDRALLRSSSRDTVGARNRQYTGARVLPVRRNDQPPHSEVVTAHCEMLLL